MIFDDSPAAFRRSGGITLGAGLTTTEREELEESRCIIAALLDHGVVERYRATRRHALAAQQTASTEGDTISLTAPLLETPEYKAITTRIDELITELAAHVNEHAATSDEPDALAVTGWLLGISVSAFDADGKRYDDMMFESSDGLNEIMAEGMSRRQARYYEAADA